MRSLQRLDVEPPTLRETGSGGKKAKRHRTAKSADAGVKLDFPDHWNEADVRGALYGSFPRVCAYCGAALAHNDRGDVEHFRPKGRVTEDELHGGYWWLAYDFWNYFLSCRVCNSSRKGDRFPILGGSRTTHATLATIHAERRALLDPEVDPVEEMLVIDLGGTTCAVGPSPGLVGDDLRRVQETIKFFDLNVNLLLIKERRRARDEVLDDLDKGRADRARNRAVRGCAHSLVTRTALARAGEPLPTSADEMRAHLAGLKEELEIAIEVLAQAHVGVDVGTAVKTWEELLWALAYLRSNAPDSSWKPGVDALISSLGVELEREVDALVSELA